MQFGKREIVTILLILLIVAGAAYYAYRVSEQKRIATSDAGQTLGGTESVMQFTDLDGNAVSFDAYSKNIRVINSWATWTPFSKDELVLLNNIADDYKDTQVVFIAINRKEPQERAKSYLDQLGELPNLNFVQDNDDEYFKAVDGYAMPETLVYDSNGAITLHVRGAIDEQKLRTHLDKLLEKE